MSYEGLISRPRDHNRMSNAFTVSEVKWSEGLIHEFFIIVNCTSERTACPNSFETVLYLELKDRAI